MKQNNVEDATEEQTRGLIERVIELSKYKTPKCTCLQYGSCDYLEESLRNKEMTPSQVGGHINLICDKYPMACKINWKNKK